MFQRRRYYILIEWAAIAGVSRRAVELLANRLEADNPRFDRTRFMQDYAKRKNWVGTHNRLHEIAASAHRREQLSRRDPSLFNNAADAIIDDYL